MTTPADHPPLYRVDERRYAGPTDEWGDPIPGARGPLEIRLREERVAKVTPKGWRLACGRFVLREANKRYACPTIAEAFESFAARKEKQARIMERRMRDALEAKNAAARLREKLEAEIKPGWGSRAYADWRDGVDVQVTSRRREVLA